MKNKCDTVGCKNPAVGNWFDYRFCQKHLSEIEALPRNVDANKQYEEMKKEKKKV